MKNLARNVVQGRSYLSGVVLLMMFLGIFSIVVPGGQTRAFASEPEAGDKAATKSNREVLYAALGAELMQYDLDVKTGALVKRGSVTLPGGIQEAWVQQSTRFLYVGWRKRGPEPDSTVGEKSGVTAFRIDPASGALKVQGEPLTLSWRPIFLTADITGTHLLVAYPTPSGLTVNQINPDGTIGAQVKEPTSLDVGFYAHEVRVEPSNKSVILVTRGHEPTSTQKEDPGALKIFDYKDGVLANHQSVAWQGGLHYRVRHLDFHPTQPWVYVTLESQNKLHVYKELPDGTLSSEPMFVKDVLADQNDARRERQLLGTLRVHPNGKFVYLANRDDGTTDFNGTPVFEGGENNIAVFAINQHTGEPTLIQSIDTRGISPRTMSFDPNGKFLAVVNQTGLPVRQGDTVSNLPASIAVFRVRADGKLDFVKKYDVEAGGKDKQLFWVGIASLP